MINEEPADLATEYGDATNLRAIEGVNLRQIQSIGRRRIWKFEGLKIPPTELLERFLARWNEEGSVDTIEKMTKELHLVPPCYLARVIVRAFVESLVCTVQNISCDLDDLELAEQKPTVKRPSHSKWYRDPALITHEGLRLNVQHCHSVDTHYSPAMDVFRNSIGKEYEDRLNAHLDRLGIAYLDEPGMRRMGYARTPDAVLLEPIAVDGLVVKWIESKAWFGDPPSHATYLRDQYWPYYNRFGPGLVIYWFGFVDEAVEGHHQKGVAVLEDFPADSRITRIESSTMDLALTHRPKEFNNVEE